MRTLMVCASTCIVSSSTGVSRRASRLNEMPLACKRAPDAPERALYVHRSVCESNLAIPCPAVACSSGRALAASGAAATLPPANGPRFLALLVHTVQGSCIMLR